MVVFKAATGPVVRDRDPGREILVVGGVGVLLLKASWGLTTKWRPGFGGSRPLCVVTESGGVVDEVGDGDADLSSGLVSMALLVSDDDEVGGAVVVSRVSLLAPLAIGLVWAWVGSARVSLEWVMVAEVGLGPLV